MSCRALNCNNSKFKNNETKSFFAFPKEEPLLSMWLDVCCKTKAFNAKTWFICSDHFSENDFIGFQQKTKGFVLKLLLKPGSVPVLKKDSVTSSNGSKRLENGTNKKLVEKLFSDSIKSISNLAETTLEIDKTEEARATNVTEPCSGDCSESFNREKLLVDIKMLQKKLTLSEKDNKNLKNELWHTKQTSEHKIKALTEELALMKAEKNSMKNQLKELFTDGQIAQIIPSIRILQRWSQKVDITTGILTPVIKIFAEFLCKNSKRIRCSSWIGYVI